MASTACTADYNSSGSSQDGSAASGRPHLDVYGIVTDRICALLEQGTVPWRKPWRSAEMLPTNLASKRPYRGVNVFLLSCAPYASPYWLTYRQAREAGGGVRKGEKGYPVIFWRWLERPAAEPDEQGRVGKARFPLLRYYTVFNVEQCDGIEAPSVAQPEQPFSPIETCERVIAGMPNRPTIEHNAGRACYRPSTDTVSLPRPELFENAGEYYCAAFHELGHATGHERRLGRDGVTDPILFGSHAYSREELVAEMTAAYLCGHCGVDNTLANSASYIAGWLRKLRDDRKLLVTAAGQAQKAADFILGVTFEEGTPTNDDE